VVSKLVTKKTILEVYHEFLSNKKFGVDSCHQSSFFFLIRADDYDVFVGVFQDAWGFYNDINIDHTKRVTSALSIPNPIFALA